MLYKNYKEYKEAADRFVLEHSINDIYSSKDIDAPIFNVVTEEDTQQVIDAGDAKGNLKHILEEKRILIDKEVIFSDCHSGILEGISIQSDDYYYIINEGGRRVYCSCVGKISEKKDIF